MRYRLIAAAQEGVLIGIKWGIAVVLGLGCLGYLVGDYSLTRQQAKRGDEAFVFIQQQIAAQQKPAPTVGATH